MPASLSDRAGSKLILCAMAALVGACSNSDPDLEGEKARQRAADMAVSVLPPGVEDAWNAYLDEQFARAVQPQGGVVRVTDVIDIPDETRLISRNSPYEINCYPDSGGYIQFGHGEGATTITVYGIAAPEPPPLGVPKNSVAAKRLFETMCARLAAHMQNAMNVDR